MLPTKALQLARALIQLGSGIPDTLLRVRLACELVCGKRNWFSPHALRDAFLMRVACCLIALLCAQFRCCRVYLGRRMRTIDKRVAESRADPPRALFREVGLRDALGLRA